MIESGKEALDIAAGSTALLALGDTVKEITGRNAK